MTCNVTRMGRVFGRRILIYAGNQKGFVGYGIGKGKDYRSAYINAYYELRKNLIAINLSPENTSPWSIKTRYHDYRLRTISKNSPSMWGYPVMILMFKYCVFEILFNYRE